MVVQNMKKRHPYKLTFALGGGGARGALQVGALRALLEADLHPDLMVGTSVGAVNAVFLAMHGFTWQALEDLKVAWFAAAKADLFPANIAWLTLRVFFNRIHTRPYQRLKDFFISQGVSPDLRFGDLPHTPVILVSADLNSSQPVYYGNDLHASVLDGLLASTALPPWVHPLERDGQFLIDGGVVSPLPIEPALTHGAREIIALDLADSRQVIPAEVNGFGPFLSKLINTMERRQVEMEMTLAAGRGVPVWHMVLKGEQPVAIWDFNHTPELIEQGYAIARREIAQWQPRRQPVWRTWLARLTRIIKTLPGRSQPG